MSGDNNSNFATVASMKVFCYQLMKIIANSLTKRYSFYVFECACKHFLKCVRSGKTQRDNQNQNGWDDLLLWVCMIGVAGVFFQSCSCFRLHLVVALPSLQPSLMCWTHKPAMVCMFYVTSITLLSRRGFSYTLCFSLMVATHHVPSDTIRVTSMGNTSRT